MNANHLFSRFSALISTIGVRKERASWRPLLILYGAYAEFLNTLTSSQHYFFQSLDKLVGIAVLRHLCELSGVCSKVLYLLQSSALRREHLSTHTGLVRTSRTKRIVPTSSCTSGAGTAPCRSPGDTFDVFTHKVLWISLAGNVTNQHKFTFPVYKNKIKKCIWAVWNDLCSVIPESSPK